VCRPDGAETFRALSCDGRRLLALDQTRLPAEEHWLELHDAAEVAAAIRRLAIRGAPLIGVAAGYGVALEATRDRGASLRQGAEMLRAARPTAVNLGWAVDRVLGAVTAAPDGGAAAGALAEARAIEAEEEAASAAIALHGAELLQGRRRILTHCNTGALAAPGRGTALAVIAELHARGGLDHVLATESRPLLQGARLTVWELRRLGIPHQLCVDSAAAGLILGGELDAVIVGCDRVAANGDIANKVGTLALALAAAAAGIPFVVAGPLSTVDPTCPSGKQIIVEEREEEEVRSLRGEPLAPPGTCCRNPAFDVTPAALVSSLVTDAGVATPVDGAAVAELLAAAA
jgi:methylthioribose-1-phosphate isomerase